MKQKSIMVQNWQVYAPWVTPFCHFVLALNVLSNDPPKIWRDASIELLNTNEIFIDSKF